MKTPPKATARRFVLAAWALTITPALAPPVAAEGTMQAQRASGIAPTATPEGARRQATRGIAFLLKTDHAGAAGTASTEAIADEKGFRRFEAMGLSVAVPDQMTGSFGEYGGTLLHGPDGLQLSLPVDEPEHVEALQPQAGMTEAGTIDPGGQPGHFPFLRDGTEARGVLNLRIANEGDDLPGWGHWHPCISASSISCAPAPCRIS